MTFKKKLILLIGALVITATLAFYFRPQTKEEVDYTAEQSLPEIAQEETAVPQATGEIDDAASAIAAFSDNEKILLNNENEDISSIETDTQEVSDYLQTYEENEL